MTDHTPSGQQAVELLPCPFCGGSALVIRCPPERDGQETLHRPQCDSCGADCGGCNTPSEAIALWNRRTAAPTAPSTAAGEIRECLSRVTDHLETWAANHPDERTADIDAAIYCARKALATPPAQKFIPADIEQWRALARKVGDFLHRKGEAFRCGEGAELLDAYEAVLARPEMRDAPPAAPAAEPPKTSWPEQAAQQCEAWAKAHRSTDMELFCRIFADDFRALARSEKGEG